LAVLTGASKDVPARQQTLRNTIAWSYNLLDAAEQQLFRRLSVFAGGCTLQAVEAVCAALDNGDEAGDTLDGVASLIDKSLLQQTEQEGEEPRFVMLETIREYGLERLTVNGEMEAARQAHAAFHLKLAEEAELELRGAQSGLWLERLDREYENLRAALQWLLEQGETGQSTGDSREMALRMGAALEQFRVIRGYHSEGRAMTPEQALDAKGPVTIPQPHSTASSLASSVKPATAYPDGLTTREVEVLRLLAQGLTDTQIAEQLVISPRTVNNHLTSIYSKIQVSSRSAATRYAIERHLL
jgi:DNA-binding CsgD family transcriptional regulator